MAKPDGVISLADVVQNNAAPKKRIQDEDGTISLAGLLSTDQAETSDSIKEDRGFAGDVASHVLRGGVQAVKGVGGLMRMSDADPEKDEGFVASTGKKLTEWADKAPTEYDILKPDAGEAKEGFVKRGVMSGVESAAPSLLPLAGGLVAGKAGAVIGGLVAGPPGAAVGGVVGFTGGSIATLFGTFGLGQYQNTYDETKKILIDKGVPEPEAQEKAHTHALKDAAWETGGEFAGDVASMFFFGALFKPAIRQGVKQTVRQLVSGGGAKEFAKAYFKSTPFEVGSEVGTAYGQTKSANEVGISDVPVEDAMAEAVIPAVVLSLVFGSSIRGMQAVEAHNIYKNLNSKDPKERINAAQAVSARMEDAESQKAWRHTVLQHINAGQEIPLSKPIVDFASQAPDPADAPIDVQDVQTPETPVPAALTSNLSPAEQKKAVIDGFWADLNAPKGMTIAEAMEAKRVIAQHAPHLEDDINKLIIEAEGNGLFVQSRVEAPTAETDTTNLSGQGGIVQPGATSQEAAGTQTDQGIAEVGTPATIEEAREMMQSISEERSRLSDEIGVHPHIEKGPKGDRWRALKREEERIGSLYKAEDWAALTERDRQKSLAERAAEPTKLPAPLSQTDAATVGIAKDEAKSGESLKKEPSFRQKLTTRFYTENGSVGSFDITDKKAGNRIASVNLKIYDTFEEADQARKEWIKEERSRKAEAKKKEDDEDYQKYLWKEQNKKENDTILNEWSDVLHKHYPDDVSMRNMMTEAFTKYRKDNAAGSNWWDKSLEEKRAGLKEFESQFVKDQPKEIKAAEKETSKKKPKKNIMENAPPGGWTEADKVPEKYRKKAESSKPTVLQGTYTSHGDSMKDIRENGSNTPERKFKADLKAYAKRLQEILGYEPNINTKGKKSTDETVSTNIAPAGGEGHIVLWKPNSDHGIYMTIMVQRDGGNDYAGNFGNDKITIGGSYSDIMYRVATKTDKYGVRGGANQWAKADVSAEELAEKIRNEVDFYENVKGAKEVIKEARHGGDTREEISKAFAEGEAAGEIEGADLTDEQIKSEIADISETLGVEVKLEETQDLSSKSTKELVDDIFSIINDHIGERGSLSNKPVELDESLYQKLKPYLMEIVNRAKAKALDARAYLFGAVDSMPEGKAKEVYEAAANRYINDGAPADIKITPKEREVLDSFYEGKKTAAELGEKQNLTLTGGPAGAGKSTTIPKETTLNHVHANADLIREKGGKVNPEAHERASELAKYLKDEAISKGYHTLYDSQLSNLPLANEAINQMLETGGEVTVGFTDIDAETSIVRSEIREKEIKEGLAKGTPRSVPRDVSVKGYNRSLPTFMTLYRLYKDHPSVNFVAVDNNVDFRQYVKIFSKIDGELTIYDQNLFDKLNNIEYIKHGEGGNARYERKDSITEKDLDTAQINQRKDSLITAKRDAFREKRAEEAQGEVSHEHPTGGIEDAQDDTSTKPVQQPDVDGTSGLDAGQLSGTNAGNVSGEKPQRVPGSQNGPGNGEASPASEAGDEGRSGRGSSQGVDNLTEQRPGIDERGSAGANAAAEGTDSKVGGAGLPGQPGTNNRITPDDILFHPGKVARINANIKAINTLIKIESKGRDATAEEKKILQQFSGWGAVTEEVFSDKFSKYLDFHEKNPTSYSYSTPEHFFYIPSDLEKYRQWEAKYGKKLHPLLGGMLTKAEWESAASSGLNAHYTSPEIINAMWKIAEQLGINKGRVLEPAAGVGHFLGLMPDNLVGKVKLAGIELDSITGRILKVLYPESKIQVSGFEKATVQDNSYDMVISNFPFGDYPIFDAAHKDYNNWSIHNYFFARSLDAVRPGGIVMAITSRYTMDSTKNGTVREYLANKADLIGAIRLPNTSFSKNAGTEVTTDIIILQKKTGEGFPSAINWRTVLPIKTKEGDSFNINEYFVSHPEMVLGEHSSTGSMYGGGKEYTLTSPKTGTMQEHLDRVTDALPHNITIGESANETVIEKELAEQHAKDGTFVIQDGKLGRVKNGYIEPVSFADNTTKVKRAKDYIGIRDTYKELIEAMNQETTTDEEIAEIQAKMNNLYDKFVKKHGPFHERGNKYLNEDDEYVLALSLEDVKNRPAKKGGIDIVETYYEKGDAFSKRTVYPFREPKTAENIEDAANLSITYRNAINLSFISRLLNIDQDAAKTQLLDKALAYENPATGLLEHPQEYLSGNVRKKLHEAEEAGNKNNVEALKRVQPVDKFIDEIPTRLGDEWIPADVIEGFARSIVPDHDLSVVMSSVQAGGESAMVTWSVQTRGYVDENSPAHVTWGAEKQSLYQLMEDSLNLKRTNIYDLVYDEHGEGKEVFNLEKSLVARQKQKEIQEAFRSYIMDHSDVGVALAKVFNIEKNNYVIRQYEAPKISHYPGASNLINLRDHQKRGVSRGLTDSTIFAHAVGTGKTYLYTTLGMELRRIKAARKPMIVVQGSTIKQFASSARKLYPTAKILALTKDLTNGRDNRRSALAKIAAGDWDLVIIPHSTFNLIGSNPTREAGFIQEQLDEIRAAIQSEGGRNPESSKVNRNDSMTVKQLRKILKRKEARMESLRNKPHEDKAIYFEDLGTDALLIDEAHTYKRGDFFTKMDNIKGLDRSASQKSFDFLMKVRYVQEKTGGKNIYLATGTPITNTLAEIWTIMRYTRPELLREYGVEHFDGFASLFTEAVTDIEPTETGEFRQVERLKKYRNGFEMMNMWLTAADVILQEDVPGWKDMVPAFKNGEQTNVTLERSEELGTLIDSIRERRRAWDDLDGLEKRAQSHVPLVLFGEAKKAAIDLRLVHPENPDTKNSKVNTCVEEVYTRYKDSNAIKGTQLVFCDMYQSPDPAATKVKKNEFGAVISRELSNPQLVGIPRFNLYADIKKKLIQKGVPENEIAIITDKKFDKDEAKERLFEMVNDGSIRVVLGSTEKLGTGVNAQERMVAIHNIDAPTRPMDLEQRIGRVIRPGNINKVAEVVNYITVNTLDSVSFTRLREKMRFVNQVLRGMIPGSSFDDPTSELQATFEDLVAFATDNPLVMKRFGLENEIRELNALHQGWVRKQGKLRENIVQLQDRNKVHKIELPYSTKESSFLQEKFPPAEPRIITSAKGETIPETALHDTFEALHDKLAGEYDKIVAEAKAAAKSKSAVKTGKGKDAGFSTWDYVVKFKELTESREFKINGLRLELKFEIDSKYTSVEDWGEHDFTVSAELDRGKHPYVDGFGNVKNIEGPRATSSKYKTLKGMLDNLEVRISDLIKMPDDIKSWIEENNKNIASMQAEMAKPFQFSEKLKSVQAELKDVYVQLETKDEDTSEQEIVNEQIADTVKADQAIDNVDIDALREQRKEIQDGIENGDYEDDDLIIKFAELARAEALLSQKGDGKVDTAQANLKEAITGWDEFHEGEAYPYEIKLAQHIITSIQNKQGRMFNGQLYSGLDPTQTLNVLRGLRDNIKEATPHIEAIGRKMWEDGKRNYDSWFLGMKKFLGDLWRSFKPIMRAVWNKLKDERGSISFEKKDSEPKTAKNDTQKDKQPIREPQDPPVSKDPKVLNLYLKDEADALVKTILNKLHPQHMTWLETMLKSPEWFGHEQIKNIVRLFMRDRNEIYHETFNELNLADDIDAPEDTIVEAAKALKNKGLSLSERIAGKVSPEYKRLQEIIDEGDTTWKRDTSKPLDEQIKAFEDHIRQQGATDETIRVWKLYRMSYDKALDLQTAQLRRMISDIIEEANFKGETPDLNELKRTLKGALAQMEEWRGFYAPRQREVGGWKVQAYKEHGPMKENREWYRDHRGSELSAQRLANKLKREGWTIFNVGEVERIPETIYQDVNAVATAKLIDAALEKLSKKSDLAHDMTVKFNEEVLREVSDAIKARGFRSTMIHRGKGAVVRGFIEDPIRRHLQYINNLSGGIAKARVARLAMEQLTGRKFKGKQVGGIDPVKEPKAFEVAQNYITEQLRNMEASDRIIGIAKSIATFKFLGFNIRSIAVNMTAIMTTAPPAIHAYAMGGKGSMFRVMKEIGRAGKDYGALMAGRKLANANEQAFMDDVHKKGWDDAQYTRDALGEISKTHSRIWSSMMDGSMYLFGASEKWNRGTTMLAAYRLARRNGLDHASAAEKAKDASDKAHGVYGKSTMPMWAQGTNPAAKIGQMMYVYSKFGHNYLQMLYDLGFKRHNIKSAMFAFLSPLVLAGGAALPFKDTIFAFAGVILRSLFGEDKDPEKWVWDIIRQHLGEDAERIGRHGLTGAAGVDISGSLSIGVGIPKNMIELTGAIGGVAVELKEAAENIGRGRYVKAVEHVLPSGGANIVRAFRESAEGVSTRSNRRVWDTSGKPYQPSVGESIARAAGFRSTDQAVVSERTWEGHREQARYNDARNALYERYRAWLLGGRDPEEHKAITKKVREYNNGIKEVDGVSRITFESLRRQAKGLKKPTKKERAILQ